MRERIEYFHYRPRPFKALFLFAFGFVFGSTTIPDYLAMRQQRAAGLLVSCAQHYPLPAPMPTGGHLER
jgi:hypothetical protein